MRRPAARVQAWRAARLTWRAVAPAPRMPPAPLLRRRRARRRDRRCARALARRSRGAACAARHLVPPGAAPVVLDARGPTLCARPSRRACRRPRSRNDLDGPSVTSVREGASSASRSLPLWDTRQPRTTSCATFGRAATASRILPTAWGAARTLFVSVPAHSACTEPRAGAAGPPWRMRSCAPVRRRTHVPTDRRHLASRTPTAVAGARPQARADDLCPHLDRVG